MTYGNGGEVRYGYDAFKRLTDVSFDTEGGARYHYTYGNSGEVAQVEDKALGTTVRSEYDLANRPMRKTTTDANGEVYAAEVSYDPYNNLACFKERVAGEDAYETGYEYDKENKPTKVTYSNGVEVQYQYDGLGRVTKRKVIDGTDTKETEYTYVKGINGNTSRSSDWLRPRRGGTGAQSKTNSSRTVSSARWRMLFIWETKGTCQ